MKKTASAVAAILFAATAAIAQDEPDVTTTAPDYSKDTLIRIFAEAERDREEAALEHKLGMVYIQSKQFRIRFGYLPFFAPLPYARYNTTRQWPDPFVLTNTTIPMTARTWARHRGLSGELRRIERSERAKVKASVVVQTD